MAVDMKDTIIGELEILCKLATTETAGTFKVRQYNATIKAIRALPAVRSMDDIPPPKKGDGLSPAQRDRIAYILEHGQLDISPAARAKATCYEAFQNIYGVGPKKAQQLVDAGYTTVDELRAAAETNAKLLNKNQRIGLRYYDDLLLRIPRVEMDVHRDMLMAAKPAALEGIIVGSYRRGMANSGDIDMLVRTADATVNAAESLRAFVETLKARGYIREVLAIGDHKCLAISQLPGLSARRLDLLVTPPAEFPFAVLYFTGSDGFNVAMRQRALAIGLSLNEHGFTAVKGGVLPESVGDIRTERDIFDVLDIEWREPEERLGDGAMKIKEL